MQHWIDKIGVFDTETTGLAITDARIVTAFVGILGRDGTVEQSQQWLADPGIEIPLAASNIHGVSTQHAREFGSQAATVVKEIGEKISSLFAEGLPVVAFNASYDFSILHHEMTRHGLKTIEGPRPVVDPLVIDRAIDTYRKGKRTLEVMASHYGVHLENSHQADSDAIAAGLIAQAMIRPQDEDVFTDPYLLHDQQITWSNRWTDNYQKFRRSRGEAQFSSDGRWPVRF